MKKYWQFKEVMVSFGNYQEYMICPMCDAHFNGSGISNKWKYCPVCGVKMDGVEA